MAPYYKYEIIYTRDENGAEKRTLICLGKLSQGRRPIVTPYTYAFRIFSSQLNIKDIAEDLDSEFGYLTSVMHFIGNEYSVDTYYSMKPNDPIFDVDYLAPVKHTIVVASIAGDEDSKKAYVVKKTDAYRVLSFASVKNTYVHTGTNNLRIHYRVKEV